MNFNSVDQNDPATNEHVDVQEDHFKVVREIGAAGTVLLKNVAGALPLNKPKSIAIIAACLRSSFPSSRPGKEKNGMAVRRRQTTRTF